MVTKLIAVIDDDAATRQMLDDLLRTEGYQVISSPSGQDAHQFILRTLPDLVMLDLWLEDKNSGVTIMGTLGDDPITRDIPIMLCSGRIDVLQMHGSMLEALGYWVQAKPFDPPTLLRKIRVALTVQQATVTQAHYQRG